MKITQPPAYEYHVGGSLPVDAPSYIKRQADQDLYEGLIAKDYCYVLNSRQMGKSSLWIQTMKRLQSENIACAAIDLTKIGSHIVTQEQWYAGIIRILMSSFALSQKLNLRSWLLERDRLSPVQRLSEFIEEILLAEITQEIVIFVDEIDSVLSLKFSNDDFFALIRYCYNARVVNPVYKRLTFCLLGVATPSDLIKDKKRTPFNIGRAIELKGFKLHEAFPLTEGLPRKLSNPEIILQEILNWTGGQPFLTQKLCKLIQGYDKRLNVQDLVQSHIIKSWESQDEPEHLKTIRDRILRNEQRAGRLLGLYQQILQSGEVTTDKSSEQIELRLSGLVVEEQGKLRVYNRIYESVFNQSWVENRLADLRPYAEAITAWLISKRTDESRLLRGQALQDAQAWALGKNLSDEDHHFLNAGQALENREYQNALKLHTFRFKKGKASSLPELIAMCDQYPDEAQDYLYNNDITQWLLGQGRTDLGNLSRKIINSYTQKNRKGLEIFVRELCKSVGSPPNPIVFVQPDKLDLGEIPVGYQTNINFEVFTKGRGFVWGDVKLEGYLPGISLLPEINSNNLREFSISLDTLAVTQGNYEGYIVFQLEGISQICRTFLKYTVRNIYIQLEPEQINFGNLTFVEKNIHFLQRALKITCISRFGKVEGRIKGNIYNFPKEIEISPDSFEDKEVDLTIKLVPTFIQAGKYEDKITLTTNIGQFEVSVKFKKGIQWVTIIQNIIRFAIILGILMYVIRSILNFWIQVDNVWFLSYTKNGITIVSDINFAEKCILNINKEQAINNINLFSVLTGFVLAIFTPLINPYYRKIIKNYIQNLDFRLVLFTLLCLGFLIYTVAGGFGKDFFSSITFVALFIIDLIAYSFTLISVKQPAWGWSLLGVLIGGILGIFQALKTTNQYSFIPKITFVGFITIITLAVAGYLATNFIKDTCYFISNN
ncbi:AAA-like domain-containing protein [Nostoc sp. TCL26-01]|uniref:AAA-like domain-containing protein n=1 Tax=Nostoc sp. TCL26-01 TaxID=2576904 RepID=UPI0015B7A19A|nr:AAA-like domain-containing protein [Nostoc sp. TCL26-01]QLE59669.1 hypothetical protein FD725_29925 [Nostoc sp. TCL26-01]